MTVLIQKVQSLSLGHLRSHIQPLQRMSGDYLGVQCIKTQTRMCSETEEMCGKFISCPSEKVVENAQFHTGPLCYLSLIQTLWGSEVTLIRPSPLPSPVESIGWPLWSVETHQTQVLFWEEPEKPCSLPPSLLCLAGARRVGGASASPSWGILGNPLMSCSLYFYVTWHMASSRLLSPKSC